MSVYIRSTFHLSVSAANLFPVTAALPAEIIAKSFFSVLDVQKDDELKQFILSDYEKTNPEMLDWLIKTGIITGCPSVYSKDMLLIADLISINKKTV